MLDVDAVKSVEVVDILDVNGAEIAAFAVVEIVFCTCKETVIVDSGGALVMLMKVCVLDSDALVM